MLRWSELVNKIISSKNKKLQMYRFHKSSGCYTKRYSYSNGVFYLYLYFWGTTMFLCNFNPRTLMTHAELKNAMIHQGCHSHAAQQSIH